MSLVCFPIINFSASFQASTNEGAFQSRLMAVCGVREEENHVQQAVVVMAQPAAASTWPGERTMPVVLIVTKRDGRR